MNTQFDMDNLARLFSCARGHHLAGSGFCLARSRCCHDWQRLCLLRDDEGLHPVWKTGTAEKSARISFASPELLWKVLTAKALGAPQGVVRSRTGFHPRGARRVDRDVKAVHSDITALLKAGVLDRLPRGGVVFPCDAVKVEFLLRAAS